MSKDVEDRIAPHLKVLIKRWANSRNCAPEEMSTADLLAAEDFGRWVFHEGYDLGRTAGYEEGYVAAHEELTSAKPSPKRRKAAPWDNESTPVVSAVFRKPREDD